MTAAETARLTTRFDRVHYCSLIEFAGSLTAGAMRRVWCQMIVHKLNMNCSATPVIHLFASYLTWHTFRFVTLHSNTLNPSLCALGLLS